MTDSPVTDEDRADLARALAGLSPAARRRVAAAWARARTVRDDPAPAVVDLEDGTP